MKKSLKEVEQLQKGEKQEVEEDRKGQNLKGDRRRGGERAKRSNSVPVGYPICVLRLWVE